MSLVIHSKYYNVYSSIAKKRVKEGYKPNMIRTKTFEYDGAYLTNMSEDLIDRFIEYQTRYPIKIKECIDLFIYCIELLENEHKLKEATGKPINKNIIHYRHQKTRENMQKIYDILDMEYHILMGIYLIDRTPPKEIEDTIYRWMKFITSQTPLNQLIVF